MKQIQDQLFKVAIYLRLSKDDGDFSSAENGKSESNSIHNQRELLMAFLAKHPEMELYGRYEETAYFVRMMKLNGHKDIVFRRLDGFGHGDMVEPGHLLLLKYIRTRNEN